MANSSRQLAGAVLSLQVSLPAVGIQLAVCYPGLLSHQTGQLLATKGKARKLARCGMADIIVALPAEGFARTGKRSVGEERNGPARRYRALTR